jgi:hypothetical protein
MSRAASGSTYRRRRTTPGEIVAVARYLRDLRTFLREPLGSEVSRRDLEQRLAQRETRFLGLLDGAVFDNPKSPYAALLAAVGIERGDVAALVPERGIEGALDRLYDAGVRVTLDEFKTYRPIERLGLSLRPMVEDFWNPLAGSGFLGASGGSRGRRRRVRVSLTMVEQEAAYEWLWTEAYGVQDAPVALWRPVPPGAAGLKQAIRFAKRGQPLERWFSQNRLDPRQRRFKDVLFAASTLATGRLMGGALPWPEHVPADHALTVARWLAEKTVRGTPAVLSTPSTSCVRICLAARDAKLDISGTVFYIGGEPVTDSKAEIVAKSGCRAVVCYAMAETGLMGISCLSASEADDVHLLDDRIAILRRERDRGNGQALHLTTVDPHAPAMMLNVESGDDAIVEERSCVCPLGAVGLGRHLRQIRSYEKLSSEGMTFAGTKLLTLTEQVLPARFGGDPIDYQFVEYEEADGLRRIAVVVSPRVGAVEDGEIVRVVTEALGDASGAGRMMAELWRDSHTLRVARREPYATEAAKVLPLYVLEDGQP